MCCLFTGQQHQVTPQLGVWQVTASKSRLNTRISVKKSHPLAAFLGRSIATAALSHSSPEGVKLTLTLADNASADSVPGAPAAPAAEAPTNAAPAAVAGSHDPSSTPVNPSASADTMSAAAEGSAGASEALAVGVNQLSAQTAAAAEAAAAGGRLHQQLGVMSPSQPSSAPSHQQPGRPAKRPAAQLDDRVQQNGGSNAAVAPPNGLISAAAPRAAAPSNSKKPRLQQLQPASAAGTTGGSNSMCHNTPEASAATRNHNAAASSALTGPAADQGRSPMQIDLLAQQQQQQQQQQPPQLEVPLAAPQQQQEQQPVAAEVPAIDAAATAAVPAGKGALPVRRQQRSHRQQQQVPQASGPSSDATPAAAAAAAAGPATPAALAPSSAELGPILHQPYSHLVWCHINAQNTQTNIASALCTDITQLQSVNGSCSVTVSIVNHPAGWEVKDYILQHPVMQQQEQLLQQHQQQQQQPAEQQAAQASGSAVGSTSTTWSLGPCEATLTRTAAGTLLLKDLSMLSIHKSLRCDGSPHALVLQERVRCL